MVLCLAAGSPASALPGDLDTSFDSDGKQTTAVGSGGDDGRSVAVQSDGKIVVAGTTGDFAVVRYNGDGSLDTTFSGDGKQTTPIGAAGDSGYAVALQGDGKIVVAGTSHNGTNEDFAVVRYNTDGSLDTTFSGDGKLTTAIGTGNDLAFGVAIQSDGKIVVAGYAQDASGFYDFAVARYNTNGSLDTTFSTDGKQTTHIVGDDFGFAVAVQSDGKIVVGGYVAGGGVIDFALVRYTTNGSLDTTFSGDGIVTTAIGTAGDYAQALAIQGDGKIVLAGGSDNGSNNDFALARYTTSGSLDTTFSGDGKLTTPIGSAAEGAYSVTVQSDGKIVAAGYSSNGANNDVALARYTSNGSLDTTFSGDGKLTVAIGAGADVGYGVALQSDRKIVVAGSSYNGSNNDFAVLRLLGGTCGDGLLDGGEGCDDGGTMSGNGCSAVCQVEAGYSCSGEPSMCSANTPTATSTATVTSTSTSTSTETPTSTSTTTGTPISTSTVTATPSATATSTTTASPSPTDTPAAAMCPAAPAVGCSASLRAQLQLRADPADPSGARNKLKWKFKGGPLLTQADFGDPQTSASLAFCVYDDGVLKVDAQVGPSPVLWSPSGTKGYRYVDSTGASDGITKIGLTGGEAGRSKLQVKGKGANLPPFSPVSPTRFFDNSISVEAQLHQVDGTCFESVFTPADEAANDGKQFKARK